jgi:hypothetical protein
MKFCVTLFLSLLAIRSYGQSANQCGGVYSSSRALSRITELELSLHDPNFYKILDALDQPEMVGQFVTVSFRENPLGQTLTRPSRVTQQIVSLELMDEITQKVLKQIKQRSTSRDGSFREVGVWIAYTKNAVYVSKILVGTEYNFSWKDYQDGYRNIYSQIKEAEGKVHLEDLEFFHTHLERGEVFSDPDMQTHQQHEGPLQKMMNLTGRFVSYAVPIKGRVFFRYSTDATAEQ